MKQKHNEGFSLVEVLVAIVILGIFVVPTCSSLVLSLQMSSKADQMLKAQLAVSSALEELKAEGIDKSKVTIAEGAAEGQYGASFADVKPVMVAQSAGEPYYKVTVTSDELDSVSVTTYIRAVEAPAEGGGT